MKKRIALQGMSRVNRLVLSRLMEDQNADIVAINSTAESDTLAYLLKHERQPSDFSKMFHGNNGVLECNGTKVMMANTPRIEKAPWESLGIDVVINAWEGDTPEEASPRAHLDAGAGQVLSIGESREADILIGPGINDEDYDPDHHRVIVLPETIALSAATVLYAIETAFGIETATFTGVHAITENGHPTDMPASPRHVGRSAIENLIPAAEDPLQAISSMLPHLDGKVSGMYFSAPIAYGGMLNLTVQTEQATTVEKVLQQFARLSGTMEYNEQLQVSEESFVSSDVADTGRFIVIDRNAVQMRGKYSIQILAWIDPDWGYAGQAVSLLNSL